MVEIRNCVKDADCIKKRLDREIAIVKHPKLAEFKIFAQTKQFDAIAHFNLFPEKVQHALKLAFPRKLEKPIHEESGGEILAGEIYRNFSYPLNDWSNWLKALGFSDTSAENKKVRDASLAYRTTLEEAAKLIDEKKPETIEKFGDTARIAISRFAKESDLLNLLKNWMKKNFPEISI